MALAPLSVATAPVASAAVVAPNHAAQVVVNTALAQLGDRYVWGAAGPNTFDCSGLAQYVYRAAGVNLPHSAAMQSHMGTPVSPANIRPGDLLSFYGGGHSGIYIGNGQIVHAPQPGDVVKITNIQYMGSFTAHRLV